MRPYTPEQLCDRQAIVDLLYYYCRGVDRHDEAALAQVYWPDGWDDHVHAKVGEAEFRERVIAGTRQMRTAHHLTNILVEFASPAVARSEAYFLAQHELADEAGELAYVELSGRYLDRFEKRDGEWRILQRSLVFDFQQTHPPGRFEGTWLSQLNRRGDRFPNDLIYRIVPEMPA